MNFEQFMGTLMGLQSPDNNVRGAAETAYAQATHAQLSNVILMLLEVIKMPNADIGAVQVAYVLLRRLATYPLSGDFGANTGNVAAGGGGGGGDDDAIAISRDDAAPAIESLTTTLLHLMRVEKRHTQRRALLYLVAQLATTLVPAQRWPALWPQLQQMITPASSVDDRRFALHCISELSKSLGGLLQASLASLRDVLAAALADADAGIRTAAIDLYLSLLSLVFSQGTDDRNAKALRKKYQKLLPAVLTCVQDMAQRHADDLADAVGVLVAICDTDPLFLKPNAPAIVETMLQLLKASDEMVEEGAKHYALEFLLSLAERKSTLLFDAQTQATRTIVHLSIEWMTSSLDEDADDVAAWEEVNDDDEDEFEGRHALAQEAIDRLSVALEDEEIGALVYNYVDELLKSTEWRCHHAAMLVIESSAEGCAAFVEAHMSLVLQRVLLHMTNLHRRVRWAACSALAQLFNDFGPALQDEQHATLLPPLMATLDDAESSRVRSHAATAIVNFCEDVDVATLAPYADALLGKLYSHLTAEHAPLIVQEQMLTAVAAVAAASNTNFARYYDTFSPYLKNVLVHAVDRQYAKLRGKAIEALTLMAVGLGLSRVAADVPLIMKYLVGAFTANLPDDDPQRRYLDIAATRMSQLLRADFRPYLEYVLPPLMAVVASGDEQVISIDSIHDAEFDEREGWQYMEQQGHVIGINTEYLSERAQAWRLLTCYAEYMGLAFYGDHVPKLLELSIPLCKYAYHEGVKDAALGAVPWMLACVAAKAAEGGSGDQRAWVQAQTDTALKTLMIASQDEDDEQFQLIILQTMHETVEQVGVALGGAHGGGDNFLNAKRLKKIVDFANKHVKQYVTTMQETEQQQASVQRNQRRQRQQKQQDDDDDDDEAYVDETALKEVREHAHGLLVATGEILNQALRFHSAMFLKQFEAILSATRDWLAPHRSAWDRHFALCLLDDLYEHCSGQVCVTHLPVFMQVALAGLADEDMAIKQAAAFGIGLPAASAGAAFAPYVSRALSVLADLINTPNGRKPGKANNELANVIDNAISSYARIVRHQATALNVADCLAQWLAWLPVSADEVEAKVIYEHFLYFIQAYPDIMVGGESFQRLPHLLLIVATAVTRSTQLLSDALLVQFRALLAHLHQSVPSNIMQQAMATLPPELSQAMVN